MTSSISSSAGFGYEAQMKSLLEALEALFSGTSPRHLISVRGERGTGRKAFAIRAIVDWLSQQQNKKDIRVYVFSANCSNDLHGYLQQ